MPAEQFHSNTFPSSSLSLKLSFYFGINITELNLCCQLHLRNTFPNHCTICLQFVCTAININYSVPAAQLQPTHNPCFRQHFIKAYYAAKFTKCILTVSLQCPFQPEALLLMQHYINYKPLNARS